MLNLEEIISIIESVQASDIDTLPIDIYTKFGPQVIGRVSDIRIQAELVACCVDEEPPAKQQREYQYVFQLPVILDEAWIKPETIEYWEQRSIETSNPFARGRYTGLIIAYAKKFHKRRDLRMVIQHIETLLDSVEEGFYSDILAKRHVMKRAMTYIIYFRRDEMLERCIELILNADEEVMYINPGRWLLAFEILIEGKVRISELQNNLIYQRMEQIVRYVEIQHSEDPSADYSHDILDAISALGEHYSKNKTPELNLLLDRYYAIIKSRPSTHSRIGDIARLQELLKIIDKYEYHLLHDRVVLELEELNLGFYEKEMKPIPYSFTIDKADREKDIQQLFKGCDSSEFINRFSSFFLLQFEKEKKAAMKERSSNWLHHTTFMQFDSTGRVTSGSSHSEEEKDSVIQFSKQNIMFLTIHMPAYLDYGLKTGLFTDESVLTYIKRNPCVQENQQLLITHGVKAYFNGDYITSTHVLIPQIEAVMRNMLHALKRPTQKPNGIGGYHLLNFDEILRDEVLTNILGHDLTYYYKLILSNPRGLNLRNNLCHGILHAKAFNEMNAIRVLHCILLLGFIRLKSEV